jgi:hypothetical protein
MTADLKGYLIEMEQRIKDDIRISQEQMEQRLRDDIRVAQNLAREAVEHVSGLEDNVVALEKAVTGLRDDMRKIQAVVGSGVKPYRKRNAAHENDIFRCRLN